MLWPCMKWPFLLARMYDPRLPEETRKAAAEEFLAARQCCLDTGFALKLRKRCSSTSALFEKKTKAFVMAFLNSLIVTTTALELGFGSVQQWLLASSKPISAALLNAKMVTDSFPECMHAVDQDELVDPSRGALCGLPANGRHGRMQCIIGAAGK